MCSRESFLQKLPDSICQLRHLGYLNLAGCSGLVTLPESIGDLINMFHIDLSGCAGLVNLPQSFGDLINLLYLDLSRCYRLTELPESFSNLKKMEHLDLSFWSCFKGIVEALGGLINVKSLNLSNPCCHLADHWPQLLELKDVWGKLPKLRYLNLSMFLNPIFYQLPEDDSLNNYLECISGLSSLEYLDLSHNIFLVDLPKNLAKLNKLHTLDLSGCARLERVDRWMGEVHSLKSIVVRNSQGFEAYQFVVCSYNSRSSNFVQLNDVSCKELEISRLENVKSMEEVQNVTLVKKEELETLKLCWSMDTEGHVDNKALFGELQPPHNLQYLELHGYNGETCFPAWWTPCNLPNLVKVIMEDLRRCLSLPPLRLLPSLQELVLRKMASITRIDLSGRNRVPFHKVELHDMISLKMFTATWYTNELVIHQCSKLVLGPLPPRAQRLVISDCDQVMSSWRNQGSGLVVEGRSVLVTELEVQNCNFPVAGWSLLHHLPGLHSLTIKNCNGVVTSSSEIFETLSSLQTLCFSDCHSMSSLPQELGCLASLKELQIVSCNQLNCLPDSMQQLTSLQSLQFTDCDSITELPEWLGGLTSLQKLAFQGCHAINYLSKSINQLEKLKDLRILNCPTLKKWWESNENMQEFHNMRL
ncbi:disease resistance protein RPV1-like [Triticum aestivum]|uniref:disease resistance protein RPV1-like n=1 Tax=Triticum aestivum TaxID=4565 RepID=UPI001D0128EA|nr:disease resistance protein RPV1-like [Triticum aestivum]